MSFPLSGRCLCAVSLLVIVMAWSVQAQAPSIDVRETNTGAIEVELGGQLLQDHELQFSRDLISWAPLLSLRLPSSPFEWIDPLASSQPGGFYRVTQWAGNAPQDFADNFRLIDHEGRSQELHYNSHLEAVVLLFIDPNCDGSLAAALADLENTFGAQSVAFWIIDPVSENRADLVAKALEWQVNMPILHDSAQLVARTYQVERGTEAVAIDTATWSIFYRGAIDSSGDGNLPVQDYLPDALTAFFAGQEATFSRTPATDCVLPLAPIVPISYEQIIAPMLIENCVRCHSPGNIAPFTLSDYN
ncbi:MAG: redoxin domain-containing protein, partial [Akkermansiaceae bacterium]|nr:redoxin domain-containing protein [Akkermansiaceae bacterium]